MRRFLVLALIVLCLNAAIIAGWPYTLSFDDGTAETFLDKSCLSSYGYECWIPWRCLIVGVSIYQISSRMAEVIVADFTPTVGSNIFVENVSFRELYVFKSKTYPDWSLVQINPGIKVQGRFFFMLHFLHVEGIGLDLDNNPDNLWRYDCRGWSKPETGAPMIRIYLEVLDPAPGSILDYLRNAGRVNFHSEADAEAASLIRAGNGSIIVEIGGPVVNPAASWVNKQLSIGFDRARAGWNIYTPNGSWYLPDTFYGMRDYAFIAAYNETLVVEGATRYGTLAAAMYLTMSEEIDKTASFIMIEWNDANGNRRVELFEIKLKIKG